jgi:hypothetical protein
MSQEHKLLPIEPHLYQKQMHSRADLLQFSKKKYLSVFWHIVQFLNTILIRHANFKMKFQLESLQK